MVAHDVPQAEVVANARAPRYVVLDLRMPVPPVSPDRGAAAAARGRADRGPHRLRQRRNRRGGHQAGRGALPHQAADADQILDALHKDEGNPEVAVSEQPLSVNRLEWEHIQKVLAECEGNVSETARKLGMHRRTLQRKLAKRPSGAENM